MKTKILFICLSIILLNSCIVKSLHPFYTKNSINFNKEFLGNWIDNENGNWEVLSFGKLFLEESKKKEPSEFDEENLKIFNKYKDGYVVNYTKNDEESVFLAIPFKINDQFFIDFTPLDYEIGLNDLLRVHLISTHSLVKFDIIGSDNVSIKWFDEDKITELFNQDKIRIEHEKVGIDETILLTASSKELEKFVKKYMASNDEKKWETSTKFNLKRIDAKP